MVRFLSFVLALVTISALASAQADENRCRSVQSIYTAPASGFGTVTGLPTDLITIKNGAGQIVSQKTVQYWKDHPKALPIYEVVPTSSGMYSVRFYYPGFGTSVVNGTVEVTRNGFVIDRDRFVAG